MIRQNQLVEILKHKGIGPNGSKTLSNEDISQVLPLLADDTCQLTTKATLLTALLLLDKSEEEEDLISLITKNIPSIPQELHFLINKTISSDREETILKLITLTDLNKEESEIAIASFFDKDCPSYLTAAFLEGERLKRETDIENIAFYNHFLESTERLKIEDEPIIEIGDSFDGVKRNNNYNLFTCCVLASMGYKVTLTGNETVAPKFGNTHHQLLTLANKTPFLSKEETMTQLEERGWCYLDQSNFHANMWNNRTMRKHMVKRPFIATFEKIASPIISSKGNYIVTSYTHAHYQNANIEILKNNPYCKKAINLKGLEGTVHPKANISTVAMVLDENRVTTETKHRFVGVLNPTPVISPEETLNQGIDFLENNTDNDAKNYVTNTCIVILKNFGLEEDQNLIRSKIEEVISSKKAINNWTNSHTKKIIT